MRSPTTTSSATATASATSASTSSATATSASSASASATYISLVDIINKSSIFCSNLCFSPLDSTLYLLFHYIVTIMD